jgi:hypothetical protein
MEPKKLRLLVRGELQAQKRFVRARTFSPDEQLLATGGEDDARVFRLTFYE